MLKPKKHYYKSLNNTNNNLSSKEIIKVKSAKETIQNTSNHNQYSFNFYKEYLSKIGCTTIKFGLEAIKQYCYVCPICNPKRDNIICKYCYMT